MRIDPSIERSFGEVAAFVTDHVCALPRNESVKFITVLEFGNSIDALARAEILPL